MRIITTLLALVAGLAVADSGSEPLLQARLKAHIEFLASDELRGRQPGTPGYDIAANYVSGQFRQMGLVPAGSEGSYFQQVPLRRAWLEEGSATMSLERNGSQQDFEFVEEFFRGASVAEPDSEISAEMVFAGYGIHAPELDYSDFENLDVEGKIVVTLGGQPMDFPSEEGAHFGSGREKARAIAAHGAVGWVTVYTPRNEKRYAWDRVRNSVGMPAMGWLTSDGTPFAAFAGIRGDARIHYKPAEVLFEGSPHSLQSLLDYDQNGEGLPAFPLPGILVLKQKSRHETIQSPNVAGLLPGSDPVLGSQYVVYTAHLDHIGELHGEGHEDAINNGAMDNASGISVMLETARILASSESPRRSVMFLAVTAEEKGLVGSEYFAQNPTVPASAIVGSINLDMPGLLHDFGDVIAFGAEHSSLGDVVENAAAEFGITLSPDPVPAQNIFVRSDHYRFVQRGIPSVYLVTGMTSLDGEDKTPEDLKNMVSKHYHKPSDEINLPFNYGAAARFTRINARIGEIVANQGQRPSWHEGDFFGTTFSR
jgi:Zn-dependent M28 family amino/carboxypeptidase